ncbi:MAG: sugar phosphate nucleotidyltransferase [Eubacterium ramulus]
MKALGIILAGGNNYRMRELSDKRAIAAMPVGGGYRAIDFALSNMSNSHIQRVAVLTQYNSRSLNEHLNSSKWWDFGRKQGGLYIFTPTITADNGNWYRGTADALAQNIDFLKRSHEPYVIVAGGDCVYKLDYNKVLDYHIQKKADITIVCKDVPATDMDVSSFGVVQMNEESRIIDFEEKPMVAQFPYNFYRYLCAAQKTAHRDAGKSMEEHRFDLVNDILIRYKNLKQIYGYKLENYWSNIASVESYYQTNMDFLKPDTANISSIRSRISTPRWMILLRQNTMWEQMSQQSGLKRMYYKRYSRKFCTVQTGICRKELCN